MEKESNHSLRFLYERATAIYTHNHDSAHRVSSSFFPNSSQKKQMVDGGGWIVSRCWFWSEWMVFVSCPDSHTRGGIGSHVGKPSCDQNVSY
ncbi:MAG: hypothetical protein UX57_C0022G0004 [Candidatus Uhrbacteria bacterium GW2011_GWE2_46_68]|uniref:Uncharacterized protein n=1 Tax=Candidatus Uhrbacteria bacterium GW2011_GWE2_46_68 TaxID=1618994 RepID=A0A0G1T457_9BACT|nr:MAG: hypothetical protein UX57_C0022G0004 [Candidatus Uhrbacteria bacterium GW2011_GWE2_46_68]